MLIRRGKRLADYIGADCLAAFVHGTTDLSDLATDARAAIEKHLAFARALHIETRILGGTDVAATLVDFARRHQITQILLLRPRATRWSLFPTREPVYRLVARARDLQVIVVSPRLPGPR
jgi:two-component system sensor histidine kinase KdpD